MARVTTATSLGSVAEPAKSIDDVLERMALVDSGLPREDGVAYFNRMYMRVTEEVQRSQRGQAFENAEFLEKLDVRFANLYFASFSEERAPSPPWAALFEERARPDTEPIQFAIAGMNAHINHDLPVAVVDTCREMLLEPVDESPQHRDYTHVDEILGEVEGHVKQWFLTGAIATMDELCGKLDDALAMWSVRTARALAWAQSQTLWALREHPKLLERYQHAMARSVDFTSRGILL